MAHVLQTLSLIQIVFRPYVHKISWLRWAASVFRDFPDSKLNSTHHILGWLIQEFLVPGRYKWLLASIMISWKCRIPPSPPPQNVNAFWANHEPENFDPRRKNLSQKGHESIFQSIFRAEDLLLVFGECRYCREQKWDQRENVVRSISEFKRWLKLSGIYVSNLKLTYDR